MSELKLIRFIGWASIGIGLAEIISPGTVSRLVGLEKRRSVLRMYGIRELAAGLGILSDKPRVVKWLWGRTAMAALAGYAAWRRGGRLPILSI